MFVMPAMRQNADLVSGLATDIRQNANDNTFATMFSGMRARSGEAPEAMRVSRDTAQNVTGKVSAEEELQVEENADGAIDMEQEEDESGKDSELYFMFANPVVVNVVQNTEAAEETDCGEELPVDVLELGEVPVEDTVHDEAGKVISDASQDGEGISFKDVAEAVKQQPENQAAEVEAKEPEGAENKTEAPKTDTVQSQDADSAKGVNITDSAEGAENADSAKGAKDVENADSAKGAKDVENADSAKITEGAENADSAKITEGAENADNAKSVKVAENAGSAESAENVENVERVKNTESSKNAENTESAKSADNDMSVRLPVEEKAAEDDGGGEMKNAPKDAKAADVKSETKSEVKTEPQVQGQLIDIAPQKLDSGEKLTSMQGTGTTEATKETLLDKMVEKMQYTSATDSQTLEIHLKPDYLGKVSIQLTMTDTGLHAKIQADDPSVKNLIGSQINTLVESLNEKGIKVTQVEVVYTDVSDRQMQDGGGGRETPGKSPYRDKRAERAEKAAGAAYEPTVAELAAQYMEMQTSSVEYRA